MVGGWARIVGSGGSHARGLVLFGIGIDAGQGLRWLWRRAGVGAGWN